MTAQTFDYKQKITASDRNFNDRFGHAVDVHKNYAIVGSPWEKLVQSQPGSFGAAYIYKRDTSGNWLEIQKITAPLRKNYSNFGWKVAIYDKVIIISDPNENTDTGNLNAMGYAGAAYIFEQNIKGNWDFKQKIVASDRSVNGRFGSSVSINDNYIAIGAFLTSRDSTLTASGKVYIFKKQLNGNWAEAQQILPSDIESNDQFGYSLSLSKTRLAIGSPFEDENALDNDSILDAGSAYIFKLNSSKQWVEEQKIVASDREEKDAFGLSLSTYGDYLAVGAPLEEDVAFNAFDTKGAVYMFKKNNSGQWTETQKIVSSDRSPKDLFGFELDLYDNLLAVGAFAESHDSNGLNSISNSGSGYLFKVNKTEKWEQKKKFTAPVRQSYDHFGWSVSIWKDYLIYGAYLEDEDNTESNTLLEAGSAFIFEHCPSVNSKVYDTTCLAYNSPSGKFTWLTSGIYNDTLRNYHGCDSFITIYLTILSAKTFDTVALEVCDSLISPSGKYVWKNSQTYFDTLQNRFGCDSILEIRLIVLKSSYAQISITSCDSLRSPSEKYTWSKSGSYTDTIRNSQGCDSILSINLEIIDKSQLKLGVSDTAVCLLNNKILFSDSFQSTRGATYQWSFGDGDTSSQNPIIKSFSKAGKFLISCIIIDSFCIDTFYSVISIYEQPESYIESKTDDSQCIENNLFDFGFASSKGKAPHQYSWIINGGIKDPPLTYLDPKTDTIKLIVTDANGCMDTSSHVISVKPCDLSIKTYNTFTPGIKDGKNDRFDIEIKYHTIYELHIYNRYGLLVFKSNNAEIDWNGNLFNNGPEASSGNYFYLLKYGTANQVKSVSGNILLLR